MSTGRRNLSSFDVILVSSSGAEPGRRWHSRVVKTIRYRIDETTGEAHAPKLRAILLRAYAVEAQLLGVADFPPMHRTVEEVACSVNTFFVAVQGEQFVGVAELERNSVEVGAGYTVASLGVDPDFFRLGIASALLTRVLASIQGERAPVRVSTGSKNAPAIRLYRNMGFEEVDCFTAAEGIEMTNYVMKSHS